jgi:hypothetical protein
VPLFGFSVQVLQSPSKLVVSNPSSLGPTIAVVIFLVLPLFYMLRQTPFPKFKFTIVLVLAMLAFGFTIGSTEAVFDKDTQTAVFRRFHYYHWQTDSLLLADIDHAYLSTGRSTERITVQLTDGGVRDFSYADDMKGKPQAVLAINHFLGKD